MTGLRGIVAAATAVVVVAASVVLTASGSVPFKGRGTGVILSQDIIGPTAVRMTAVGEGTATHLGNYTRTEDLLLNPSTGVLTGTIVFTAANGDQLACRVTAQFVSAVDAVGTYDITGGTGRFEQASGDASFSATLTAPGTFTVSFSGDMTW